MAQTMDNEDFFGEGRALESRMTAEASGSSMIYQALGDQTIYEQNPPFYLRQVPLSAPVVEPKHLGPRPSRMLRTYFEVVPFSGRETELSQLKKWRDTAVAETAVHLIHGPGGQGKTRLAIHLARLWAAEGWTALQAYSLNDFGALDAAEIVSAEEAAGRLILG